MAEALLKPHYVAVVEDAPPVWNVLFVCTYLLYHIAALLNSSDTDPRTTHFALCVRPPRPSQDTARTDSRTRC